MDGAVQPGREGTLQSTIQDRIEEGRGPPITERMEPEAVGKIMDHLFPQLPALVVTPQEDEEGPPLLTAEEIDAAVDQVRAKAKKAPGPDGIPNSVWTIVHRANPRILDAVFNLALKSGVFPTQ